jgi:hypothetical protein
MIDDAIEADRDERTLVQRTSPASSPSRISSPACLWVALGAVLAGSAAGCQSQSQNLPVMTLEQASKLPPDQLPTMFIDPTNSYGSQYSVHETDGLSRNPDDCTRWGCVDVGAGGG